MDNKLQIIHDFMNKHEWVTISRTEIKEVHTMRGLDGHLFSIPSIAQATEKCICCCGLKSDRVMNRANEYIITKIYE